MIVEVDISEYIDKVVLTNGKVIVRDDEKPENAWRIGDRASTSVYATLHAAIIAAMMGGK